VITGGGPPAPDLDQLEYIDFGEPVGCGNDPDLPSPRACFRLSFFSASLDFLFLVENAIRLYGSNAPLHLKEGDACQ